jgi:hypothetical protein
MADVFLSYSREDRARAEQIAHGLSAAGVEVFWDNEIPPGHTWADYIETKLTQCKALIVLWSEHSTKSQWVREEARMGRDKGVLIPVMIDGSTPPFGFGEVQAANLADWDGDANNANWRRFVEAVANFASSAPRPAPQSFVSGPPRAAPAQQRPPGGPQHAGAASGQSAKRDAPIWLWVAGAVAATIGVIAVIAAVLGSANKPPGADTAAQVPPQTVAAAPTAPAPAPAPAQSGDQSPQAIILGQLQQAQAALAQQGFQMVGQPYSGGLQQGQTWDVPTQLYQGYDYRVLGVCDRDCADLDLVLFDANGQIVTQDTSTTSQPFIGVQPPYNGAFTVRVNMFNCSVAPCYYALALYARPMQ